MTTPAQARFRLLLATGSVVISLAALAFAVSYRANQNTRFQNLAHQNCEAVEHLKTYAYQSAARALTTLPTLAYYHEHPEELSAALLQVREQIRFFAPKPCP